MVWDPTQPATNAPLLSSTIRDNWAALDTTLMAPLTALANGQVLVKSAGPVIGGVTAGSDGQVLTLVSGAPAWTSAGVSYPLRAPDGTTAAPSYSWTSDSDTGLMRRSAPNAMVFVIDSAGQVGISSNNELQIRDSSSLAWSSSPTIGAVSDLYLRRDAANILAQRNGTNPQSFRLYNTYTDAANNEYLNIQAAAASTNIRQFATGTGTQRDLNIYTGDGQGFAVVVRSNINNGVLLGGGLTPTSNTSGRVTVGGGASTQGTSGQSRGLVVYELFAPTASSTMQALPLYITPTINYQAGGAGAYEAIRLVVTETALPTGANYLMRLSAGVSGVTDMFSITNTGTTSLPALRITTTGSIGFSSTATFGSAPDVLLVRDAANTLAQRNGTNSQTLRLYNTYTDASNNERLEMTSGASYTILVQQVGSGSSRNLTIGTTGAHSLLIRTNGSDRWRVDSAGMITPETTNAYDLGSTGGRVRGIYLGTAQNFTNQASAPSTPAAGSVNLYSKTDKKMYIRDDAGVETLLGGAGGAMSNPMTAVGDLIVGTTGGAPAALPAGTNGYVLTLASGTPAWSPSGGVTYPLFATDGTSGAPSYAFASEATLGLYRASAGAIGVTGRLLAPDGTAAAPAYSFASENIGFFRSGAGLIGVGIAAAERIRFESVSGGGAVRFVCSGSGNFLEVGSAITSFDLALIRDGAGILAQRNSTNPQTLRIYNTYTDASNNERLEIAAGATGSSVMTTQIGTGVARALAIGTVGAGNLSFNTTNTARWVVQSGGTFYPNTDNALDIGFATNRVRNLYLGTGQYFSNQASAPATPAAGTVTLYSKTADKKLYLKDDGGVETDITSGFANPMTTAGDLIVGGASGVAGRLGAGSNTQVLTLISGTPAWVAPSPTHIELPLHAARFPDGTANNLFPQPVERVSTGTPPAGYPKLVELTYQFDLSLTENLIWKTILPASFVGDVDLTVKYSMISAITGQVRVRGGLAQITDASDTRAAIIGNTVDSADLTVPTTLGNSSTVSVRLVTGVSTGTTPLKAVVTLAFVSGGTNALGDRVLEAAWLTLTRTA